MSEKYYSRKVLEQYLKNTRFNKILDIIDEVDSKIEPNSVIDVKFCNKYHHRIINDEGKSWCTILDSYTIYQDLCGWRLRN